MSPLSKKPITYATGPTPLDISDEAAEVSLKALFRASVWPDDDGNNNAVLEGFIECCLVWLDAAFFVGDALRCPCLENLHAGIATSDRVDNRQRHTCLSV